ncbi:uncharacterized protein At1g65710-like [Primulina huaijiensis]|uniref:uncharacterized protein At1g65710-like n=1 Tax=Primulina huaijiensis TaxID=1492673 RepID=UPI003CC7305C
MGSCLSKKSVCVSSSPSSSIAHSNQPERIISNTQLEKNKAEEETVKKEIFLIKHRKSHDRSLQSDVEGKRDAEQGEESGEKSRSVSGNSGAGNVVEITAGGGGGAVRSSSCTKEELDAILIQCGRLSRSSSTGKATSLSESCGKKYSGSKRSFDFDSEGDGLEGNGAAVDGDERDGAAGLGSESRRNRNRSRQPSGRRRTPSRERERRVSRSPGRRSESPAPNGGPNSCPAISGFKPAKMVSVPATDKSGNGCAEPDLDVAVKRNQVKRNAGGDGAVASRTASTPRTQSPARVKVSNENQNVNPGQVQQPLPLSRSNSRKAEISPCRRNPLGEIDTNIILQTPQPKQNADTNQGAAENKLRCSNPTNSNCKTKNETQVNVITCATEGLQPFHSVIRSRSSRLSREIDVNPDALSNPVVTSYTSLLLEDIQNFHQKKDPPVAFSLPPCVTKACSILEAVADLNSTTSSNFSSTFSKDGQRNPVAEQLGKSNETNKPISGGSPLMESEVVVDNNLMDPAFHKYVTVGRGAVDVDEFEEQESSGSNSFMGGQQNWISPFSWEPNSVDSTDRWASSRSVKRQHEVRHVASDSGKKTNSKKREFDNQRSGIGRGRIGSRGAQKAAAAAT